MKSSSVLRAALFATALTAGSAFASPFTNISPLGVNVTTVGASTVGGVVIDLYGSNGAHIVSQLTATSLYSGTTVTLNLIGTQTGYTSTVTNALGGGLQAAAFRFTLFDGDTAAGNFDFNENKLLVNGVDFGNWSTVQAQETDGLGNVLAGGFSGGGFRNDLLDTGWFSTTNTALLNGLFASMVSTNAIKFELKDLTPNDNVLDFKQGINTSMTNVGSPPVIASAVPEPGSIALLGLGLACLAGLRKKQRK